MTRRPRRPARDLALIIIVTGLVFALLSVLGGVTTLGVLGRERDLPEALSFAGGIVSVLSLIAGLLLERRK